jgi:hypothetical protein
MNRPYHIATDEIRHVPDHAEVVIRASISHIGDVEQFRGSLWLHVTIKDNRGELTVLADKRFEYTLIDKQLPVLVVGRKVRMNGQDVIVADSLNFPVPPTLKFKHVLAAMENR